MAERNLPVLKLPAPPAQYSQTDEAAARRLMEQHWHPGTSGSGGGNTNSFATVLLPLDNGTSAIADGQYVTAPITFGYTIAGYRLIDDCGLSGSIQIRVDYATDANYPTFTEISGTQRPQLVGSREQERTTLDGWTSTVGEAYSQLRATVIGDATALTRVVLAIALTRVDTATTATATSGGTSGTGGSDVDVTGSVWHDGVGAPGAGLGNDGDYYLNDTTDDVYAKSGGTWTLVANIGGTPGSGGAVPTLIPSGSSFTVSTNFQALFSLPIDVEGLLVVDGDLVEVA